MCGICGASRDPGGVGVDAMLRTLVHRGPDDEGLYADPSGAMTLGARRLSIVDVEGGHQPLANEDGRVWAVLNGEIYNHRGLRDRLRDAGHSFQTTTDTEVLVHLYEEYGDGLVHALDGMYAFAIWDRGAQRLLIARDRFGEKPLFYSEHGGRLTFASELTALTASGRVAAEVVPSAVDAFFVFGYVAGPRTMFRDARSLDPAHTLTWDARTGETVVSPYWTPPVPIEQTSERVEELVAETGRLLSTSMASRMVADVPVGVFLSGGIDSSLCAALAAQGSSSLVRTYTIGYDVGRVGETGTARLVASALGTDHHEFILTEAEAARRVPALLGSLDQPLADQALVPLHAISEYARQDVKVVVGGEGADELFGGYPRYRWLEQAAKMSRRLPPAATSRASGVLRRSRFGERSSRVADLVGPPTTLERHLDWVTLRRREARRALYGVRMAGVDDDLLLRELAAQAKDGGAPTVASELMRLDQLHWLPGDVLAKADRASMLVSVEMRAPFLDRELAELAASVGSAVHLSGGGKRLLRDLTTQLLPQVPPQQRKTAFRVPAADWLRGPLAPALRRQVDRGSAYAEGWLNRDAARHLVDQHLERRRDWTHLLWPLLAFGVWHDRLVDSDA